MQTFVFLAEGQSKLNIRSRFHSLDPVILHEFSFCPLRFSLPTILLLYLKMLIFVLFSDSQAIGNQGLFCSTILHWAHFMLIW